MRALPARRRLELYRRYIDMLERTAACERCEQRRRRRAQERQARAIEIEVRERGGGWEREEVDHQRLAAMELQHLEPRPTEEHPIEARRSHLKAPAEVDGNHGWADVAEVT